MSKEPHERLIRVSDVGWEPGKRWQRPFRRWATIPFGVLIGWLACISGLAGLLGIHGPIQPLDKVLPGWAVTVFQATYLLAGVALIAGIGIPSKQIEGFGLVLISTSVAVRMVAQWALIGLDPLGLVTMGLDLGIIAACAVRFGTLAKGQSIVRYKRLDDR